MNLNASSLVRLGRRFVPVFVATFVLGSIKPAPAADSQSDPAFSQNKRLGRGVNVLGYDPIWNSFEKGRFKQRYFQMLHDGGFDSIRLNLYPFKHMGPAPDYTLSDAWWHTTDWAVSNALKAGLAVIIDFHEYETMGKDAAGNKDRMMAFWKQVAPRLKDAPADVMFEILNEPNHQLTDDLWNQYLAEGLQIIRQSNPNRTVVIGPASYNNYEHLSELQLPKEDRNIIVTFHYYLPMDFTHQGAPWANRQNKLGVVWEGSPPERASIAAHFKKVADWARENNRPILLGEFGAYDKGDMASRARYTDCIARTAEKDGFSWAYWQFDSDFIVYDISREEWVGPIHDALVPVQERSAAAK